MHSFSSLRPMRWAACVLLAAWVGCGGLTAEDARVCAGVECSAGYCIAEGGQPVCHCGAWEQALGIQCLMKGAPIEPDDTLEGATALTPSDAARTFAFSERAPGDRDTDTFVFEATAGHAYHIACNAPGLGCRAQVLSAEGSSELSNEGTPGVTLYFVPSQTGRYYVRVAPRTNASGPYTLRLLDAGTDDFGDSRGDAHALTPSPESFSVRWETPWDKDVFSLAATAGRAYRFACTSSSPGVWKLELEDATGQLLSSRTSYSDAQGVASAKLEFKAPGDGPLFVSLSPAVEADLGSASCRLEDLGADEYPDTFATAAPFTPTVEGTLIEGARQFSGDVDVFTFTPVAGHLYRFVPVRQASGCDGTLYLATSTQRQRYLITQVIFGDSGMTPYLAVEPSGTGEPCGYAYRLEDRGPDDHGGTADTATPLAVGTPLSVSVEGLGDLDDLTFNLTAQRLYQITITPPPTQDSLYFPPQSVPLFVGSPAGGSLGSDGSYRLIAKSRVDGPALLQFRSADQRYQVLLEELGFEDHGDTPATATPLALGQTASGHMEFSYDKDVFSVPLEAGRSYQLAFTGAEAYWEVVVFAPNGTQRVTGLYASGGPYSSQTATFTPSEAGTYFVQVSASTAWLDYQFTLQ